MSQVAMIFGGGGHVRAAGCKIQGNIEQVKNQIINTVRGYLK